jgi:ADP-heptose:LPS heptosyltransferase
LILPSPDGLGTLLLSNIPFVVAPRLINGTSPFETIGYRLMASFAVRTDHRIGAYAPGEYLRLLEPVGIVARDTTKHLGFSGAAGIAANKFMSDHHLGDHIVVAITPSAGDKTKIWPADRFAEIADYLIDKYDARVVLIGSEHDRPEVESMIKGMRHQPINAINCFSIDEMKAFVSKMSLLIGSDTGLIYVAEAFRVPTIDIVGPMNEYEQPPRGKFHKTIVASRRKPALGLIDNRIEDMSEFKRQIDDITVGMVEKEVDELLPLLKSKASML